MRYPSFKSSPPYSHFPFFCQKHLQAAEAKQHSLWYYSQNITSKKNKEHVYKKFWSVWTYVLGIHRYECCYGQQPTIIDIDFSFQHQKKDHRAEIASLPQLNTQSYTPNPILYHYYSHMPKQTPHGQPLSFPSQNIHTNSNTMEINLGC